MKTCDEMLNSLYERRAQYVTAQRKKKKVLAGIGITLCAVSLLGGGVWYLNRPQHDIPVIPTPDENEVTTTVDVPTEGENTTTTTTVNTTASTTTDGGIVTPPTTTVPTPSKPTGTKAPTTGKTDPPKSTSGTKGSVTAYIPPLPTATQPTAGSDKLLITGDEPDNSFSDQGSYSKNEIYISRSLQEKMDQYKGVDVLYAVHVAIPATREDKEEDFWASTEELVQLNKEYYEAYFAYDEEATRLNPSWDRLNASDIEVWTDTMRANYESYLVLGKKRNDLIEQCRPLYLKSVLAQRLEALTALCEKEPIYIESNTISVFRYAYYVELTAEQINTLAAQGGYVFRLASEPNDIIVDM